MIEIVLVPNAITAMKIADVGQLDAHPRGRRGGVFAGNVVLSKSHHTSLTSRASRCAGAVRLVEDISAGMQRERLALPHEVTEHPQVFSRR